MVAGRSSNFVALFLCFALHLRLLRSASATKLAQHRRRRSCCRPVGAVISFNWRIQHAAFDGQACWFLSLFCLGFSSLMGAVNYLTTIIKLRCPGMTMFRMPLWSGACSSRRSSCCWRRRCWPARC